MKGFDFSCDIIPLHVLPFLNVYEALNARLVCQTWCNVITARTSYWQRKKEECLRKLLLQYISIIPHDILLLSEHMFCKAPKTVSPFVFFQSTVLMGKTPACILYEIIRRDTGGSIMHYVLAQYFQISWNDIGLLKRFPSGPDTILFIVQRYFNTTVQQRFHVRFDWDKENENISIYIESVSVSVADLFAPFEEWLLT